MYELKAYYRRRFLEERRGLPAAAVADLSRRIAGHVIRGELFRASTAVLLYSPADNEPDTAAIRVAAEAGGRPVYYPRQAFAGAGLEFVRVSPREPLANGRWHIEEPSGDEVYRPGLSASTLVIVPGVGFDSSGTRLGRGGGHYDRALRRLTPRERIVGLAFGFQLVPSLPRAAHDVSVECVVIETGIVRCDRRPACLAPFTERMS